MFDLCVLDDYAQRGLLRRQRHPSLPLTIYNYTSKAAYLKAWDEVTLTCRGLVLDDAGRIVARPMRKFFATSQLGELPEGRFSATEKLDGSLIIAFRYDGEDVVASRGSFTSPQADWGKELLDGWHQGGEGRALEDGLTYLLELLHRDNRIVVFYPENKLVLLGVVDTDSGRAHRASWEFLPGIETVKSVDLDWSDGVAPPEQAERLLARDVPNEEGYVLRWPGGEMAKLKFDTYCRLHRIVTGLTSKDVWRALMDDGSLDEMLEHVPDEFNEWVRNWEGRLLADFSALYAAAEVVAGDAAELNDTRKDRAGFILNRCADLGKKALSGACFCLLDGKVDQARKAVWAMVEPPREQPFEARADT